MRLIDADALLVRLNTRWEDTIRAIKKSPTIEAEPVKHGRWKYYRKQNIAVCTNCSFERDLSANFGNAISCPNCGAEMDLEETK